MPLTLGTAGHVDHGKTWLVRALTGTDTDRLPEERARGISIELGYAALDLPDGRRLSVVDVPGHERFVRTMVAGATGIDLFLLVVDAGEGARAQTHEHLAILRLLGVERGVAAVTKVDAVDAARVGRTSAEVRALVPESEVVEVSAATGAGLDALVAALGRAAGTVGRRERFDATRLYVDRVFSLAGAGTVATGTLWSGSIGAGDRLAVLPAGFEVRVRSVQAHGAAVERARAGQRVAVAVLAAHGRRPARGDALVEPGAYPLGYRLDVALDDAEPVAHGARVQVCHGTSAVPARVVRIDSRYAQLRLDRPLVAARGDRLVLRRETTVGGARVLDPAPPRRPLEARMRLLDGDDPAALLLGIVSAPVTAESLRRRALLDDGELEDGLRALGRAGPWVFAPDWLEETRARAEAALAARARELDPGLPASALVGQEPWAAAVVPLLGLESRDGRLYLPGTGARAAGRGDDLEARLAESGLEPVEVADGELARQLEREGRIVRLGDGGAIGPDAYERARAVLLEECERAGTISLARYRDLLGASRRVSQLLLERFDADRLTIRVGDARRLRRSAARR
jgi:selenocysteine-specific elongation factor